MIVLRSAVASCEGDHDMSQQGSWIRWRAFVQYGAGALVVRRPWVDRVLLPIVGS